MKEDLQAFNAFIKARNDVEDSAFYETNEELLQKLQTAVDFMYQTLVDISEKEPDMISECLKLVKNNI